MAELGQTASLKVVKEMKFGVYLDAGNMGRVLLPKRYVAEGLSVGDYVEVFLYSDSEDIPIATTRKPKVSAGQCALLKVNDINDFGAFVDWGLEKDLMIPYSEQESPLKVGQKVVVVALLDRSTQRLLGSTKLSRHLYEESKYYKRGQEVSILVCGKTEMGFKVVINHRHLGLVFRDDAFVPLKYGESRTAYIKTVRSDGKIDISLQPLGKSGEEDIQHQILAAIKDDGGALMLSDKSPPDLIYARFKVSKKVFKRALSSLYKARKVMILDDRVTLAD